MNKNRLITYQMATQNTPGYVLPMFRNDPRVYYQFSLSELLAKINMASKHAGDLTMPLSSSELPSLWYVDL